MGLKENLAIESKRRDADKGRRDENPKKFHIFNHLKFLGIWTELEKPTLGMGFSRSLHWYNGVISPSVGGLRRPPYGVLAVF